MSDPLRRQQSQGDHRKHNLKHFRSTLLRTHSLHPPLRRRPRAQTANSPNYVKVDQRTHQRRDHHRNTNRVAMKAMRRSVDAQRRLSQRTETNRNAQAADRHHRRARALQDDKYQTRHADKPRPSGHRLFRGNGCRVRGTTRFKGHLSTTLSPHRTHVEYWRYVAACSAKFPINGIL
jgi:hypothetical protein